MSTPDVQLEPLLKRLNLANTRRVYRTLIQRAETEGWSYSDFLTVMVTEEVAHRQQTRIQRLTRRAGFPFLKTIEEFDFTLQSTLRLHLLGSTLTADFVTEGRSLVLTGKPGRGKTHLAVAIAYRAIQNGFDALFLTAAGLIDELSLASRQGELSKLLPRYTHPDVLVVDEVGYLSYGTDAANMLFHVVNERHLRGRSMIFTTNKHPTQWGGVLHDEDLAAAIVDRILERGRLYHLDGPSMRTRHLALDKPTPSVLRPQPDRISGIHRTEFPEPTGTLSPRNPQIPIQDPDLVQHPAAGQGSVFQRILSLCALLMMKNLTHGGLAKIHIGHLFFVILFDLGTHRSPPMNLCPTLRPYSCGAYWLPRLPTQGYRWESREHREYSLYSVTTFLSVVRVPD